MRSYVKFIKYFTFTAVLIFVVLLCKEYATAATIPIPTVDITVSEAQNTDQVSRGIQLFFVLTLITLSPFLLIMLTSFTRIIITLHFVRAALGTQQMPPNQILIGLALFLTLFIMQPVFTEINEEAIIPYSNGQITQEQAIDKGVEPLRSFMFSQTDIKDIELFAGLAKLEPYQDYETMYKELPLTVLIPAFLIGELTKGFKIGFILYIPFIAIDMIVASVLMAMGMMMLPPAMISLPFKMLFFILADGWKLIMENLVATFQ